MILHSRTRVFYPLCKFKYLINLIIVYLHLKICFLVSFQKSQPVIWYRIHFCDFQKCRSNSQNGLHCIFTADCALTRSPCIRLVLKIDTSREGWNPSRGDDVIEAGIKSACRARPICCLACWSSTKKENIIEAIMGGCSLRQHLFNH